MNTESKAVCETLPQTEYRRAETNTAGSCCN